MFLVDDIDHYNYYRGTGHFQRWPEAQATVSQALERNHHGGLVVAFNPGVGALDAGFASEVLGRALGRWRTTPGQTGHRVSTRRRPG